MIVRNSYLNRSVKVAGDHGSILRKDFCAVAVAVAVSRDGSRPRSGGV
ncbi:hypothetical protein [Streptomyces sp. NPDC001415]